MKELFTSKRSSIRSTANFTSDTMEARSSVFKEKYVNKEFISYKDEGEIKRFPDKQKLRKYFVGPLYKNPQRESFRLK